MTEQERKAFFETRDELKIWFDNEPNWLSSIAKAQDIAIRGYYKLKYGDIVIHKNTAERTEDEIAFFEKHNYEVRKEIFTALYKKVDKLLFENSKTTRDKVLAGKCKAYAEIKELILETAKECGVEVKE